MGLISRVSSRTYRRVSSNFQRSRQKKNTTQNHDYPHRAANQNLETAVFRRRYGREQKIDWRPPRNWTSEFVCRQGAAIVQIQGIRERKLHLAALSLGADRWGNHISTRTVEFARKRASEHAEAYPGADGAPRPKPAKSGRS